MEHTQEGFLKNLERFKELLNVRSFVFISINQLLPILIGKILKSEAFSQCSKSILLDHFLEMLNSLEKIQEPCASLLLDVIQKGGEVQKKIAIEISEACIGKDYLTFLQNVPEDKKVAKFLLRSLLMRFEEIHGEGSIVKENDKYLPLAVASLDLRLIALEQRLPRAATTPGSVPASPPIQLKTPKKLSSLHRLDRWRYQHWLLLSMV